MINCAQKLLKQANTALQEYASAHSGASFWEQLESLGGLSLQTLSLERDAEFFAEINSVLNVVTTIIVHPHIVNQRESIIIRAEQAHGLTPDMFLDTVHDQQLWKDKRGVMTPQEVYYYQNVDDLCNYENRFVVHLLDKIGAQIADYNRFYDYMLRKAAKDRSLVEEGSRLEALVVRLETLSKKLRRIKNTFFYRVVSQSNTNFTRVEATNVLKHNRAYSLCFRFYVRNITYTDEQAQAEDLTNYCYTRLLLALKQSDFAPVGKASEEMGIVRHVRLQNAQFAVQVERFPQPDGLLVTVRNKALSPAAASRNLLLMDGTVDFAVVAQQLPNLPADVAVDAIGLWDLATVDGGVNMQNVGGATETELLVRYVSAKTRMLPASRTIYEKHCPVCGGRDLAAGEEQLHCSSCGCTYSFVGDSLWLSKTSSL